VAELLDILTQVTCEHGGVAELGESMARVRLSGVSAVSCASSAPVVGCAGLLPGKMGPTGVQHVVIARLPCSNVDWVTATMRVTSDGRPLLLASSEGEALPDRGRVRIKGHQTRVRAL